MKPRSAGLRARSLTLLAAVMLIATAACGDDGSDSSGATATTTSPTSDSTAPPTEPPPTEPPPTAPPPPTAAEIDPCQLVSKQQAEALMGTPLDDGVLVAVDSPTCTYTGPVTGPTAQVEVFVGDGAKKIMDIDRDLGHTFTVIDGIADEAHLQDGSIFVRKGDLWVAIRFVSLRDPVEFNDPLVALATEVAAAL